MKTVYLLILVFLVACIIGTEVYIHQIKGIGFFQAPTVPRALWIIELLIMLLLACLIGFAIAWQLRGDSIVMKQIEIDRLISDRNSMIAEVDYSRAELNQSQIQLRQLQETPREEIKKVNQERDRLREDLNSIHLYIEELKSEKSQWKKKSEQLEKEIQLNLDDTTLLKNSLEKVKTENESLHSKLTKPFVLPPRDDLKLIHGIGPSIEKKLNALGIYSFRQISEFTPRTIDEITSSIKFFPGRIERDNWVSQARNFEEEKKRQSVA
jgi:predicted flap endonuclease-1-like 5' DNA nuclease